jgi:hypothetical protein
MVSIVIQPFAPSKDANQMEKPKHQALINHLHVWGVILPGVAIGVALAHEGVIWGGQSFLPTFILESLVYIQKIVFC